MALVYPKLSYRAKSTRERFTTLADRLRTVVDAMSVDTVSFWAGSSVVHIVTFVQLAQTEEIRVFYSLPDLHNLVSSELYQKYDVSLSGGVRIKSRF